MNMSELSNLEQSDILNLAKGQLEKEGYWIFSSGNTERSFLLNIADSFGKRQGHAQADPDGVRDVTSKSYPAKSENANQQYAANTVDEFTLHTDGTFLDGITKTKDDHLVSVSPPQMVLLQVVQPAASGGESTVLDCLPMLEDALHQDPQLVEMLMKPDFVYSRDDQCAKAPILNRISSGVWSIRWRYDFATLTTPESCDAFNLFHRKYISNPKYLKCFPLQPGDILIADNLRVLHGRQTFTDAPDKPRLLRRIWVANKEQAFVNPLGQPQQQQVYSQYQSYSYVGAGEAKMSIAISTGIRFSPESQAIAEQLLNKATFHW